jgi:DNA-binding NarL/FixJ family response regulator
MLGALLLASLAASIIESQLTRLVLVQVTARAIDQVQVGLHGRMSAADFEPPYTAAKLQEIGTRLDPLLARARQADSHVIRFNLFARDGTIIYSDLATLRGQVISPLTHPPLAQALAGSRSAEVSNLQSLESDDLRARYGGALEVYVPYLSGGEVFGAFEFYQDLTPIQPIRPLVWAVSIGGFSILTLAWLRAVAPYLPRDAAGARSVGRPNPGQSGLVVVRRLRIVLAEEVPLVRELLVTLLGTHPDLELVASVGDGLAAAEAVRAHRPDVVVLDVGLASLDVCAVLNSVELLSPVTRIVLLAARESLADLPPLAAAAADASRTVVPPSELVATIRAAARGEVPHPTPAAQVLAYGLTRREVEILRLLATDRTYREIADELVLSEETIRSHVKHLRRKLGQPSRAEAVKAALKVGIL